MMDEGRAVLRDVARPGAGHDKRQLSGLPDRHAEHCLTCDVIAGRSQRIVERKSSQPSEYHRALDGERHEVNYGRVCPLPQTTYL